MHLMGVLAATLVQAAAPALADQVTYSFNVSPGNCKVIAQPPNNKPVHMMGSTIAPAGLEGDGEVVILRSGTADNLNLRWAGVDFAGGVGRGIEYASSGPKHIMYLDFLQNVDVQTAYSSKVQVCNSDSARLPIAGYLTFLY